jgi:hypothetical protein
MTRWRCCSTARRRGGSRSRATSFSGAAATRPSRQTTSGCQCGRRNLNCSRGHCQEKVAAAYDSEASPAARQDGAAAMPAPPAPALVTVIPTRRPVSGWCRPGPQLTCDGGGAAGRAGTVVRAAVLYRRLLDGWVQRRVRQACRRAGFSHVVGYAAAASLGAVEVDSLLDAASHGPADRWHPVEPDGGPARPRPMSSWRRVLIGVTRAADRARAMACRSPFTSH